MIRTWQSNFSHTTLVVLHSVQKIWTPLPLYGGSSSLSDHPTFLSFHSLFLTLFWQYRLNGIWDQHKNKLMWQSYSFIFQRPKNNITCFLYKQHFYMQHEPEILCKIITYLNILSIKRSQKKNEQCRWKILIQKSINF